MSAPIVDQVIANCRTKCFHFTGIQNKTCGAGVSYLSVRDSSGGGPYRWPCLQTSRPCTTTCAQFRAFTEEEARAEGEKWDVAIREADARIQAGDCPHCGKPMEPSTVVRRCKYGACGCRIGQVESEEFEP